MTTANGSTHLARPFPSIRSSLQLLVFTLLPALVMAAQQETPVDREQLDNTQEVTEAAPDSNSIDPIPAETHATQQAPQELLTMAVQAPEQFIGKTLVLDDGVNVVTVGPVLELRRRIQDQNVYLIVDAMAYFNSAVQYAVAVSDVERMEADRLVIPEAPGMHLKGLDYYPDDYTDVVEASVAPIAEDD